jgi:uncharacterized integral membrane protein
VKKKTLLTSAFISVLLLSAVTGILFVNFGQANPYAYYSKKEGDVSPPEGTLPPIIVILSPRNNTAYASHNISLIFSVRMPESNNVSLSISEIYYMTSWQHDTSMQLIKISANRGVINLTDIPEGPRSLEVYANATGFAYNTHIEIKGIDYIRYYVDYAPITGSSSVKFTIDTTAPSILSLSVENKTYAASNVPLTITTNEPVSQVTYNLDGQANVTVAGNTTLTGLPGGTHNVKVYATDNAENTGASETTYFTTEEPFPTILVIVAGASVGFVSFWLIFFSVIFRRRTGNHEKTNISGRADSQKNSIKGGEA